MASVLKPRTGAAAERCAAVVLCAELRNFTRMSEMLDPGKVLQLASDFFNLAAQAIESREGEVLQIHNDSVFAAFRTGKPAQFGAKAVEAAQHLQLEFGDLSEAWHKDYGLQVAVAIGLHLGDTVFGKAGPAGAEQRMVFGDSVSVVERLLHRARAGEFVLSQPLMAALVGSEADFSPKPLPPLEIPRRPPIPIYGVLLDTRLDFT